jgi:hypothetical protein
MPEAIYREIVLSLEATRLQRNRHGAPLDKDLLVSHLVSPLRIRVREAPMTPDKIHSVQTFWQHIGRPSCTHRTLALEESIRHYLTTQYVCTTCGTRLDRVTLRERP